MKFKKEDLEHIQSIITRYRNVSSELFSQQKKAKEIQNNVNELQSQLSSIKKEEDKLMTNLHHIYGNFSLQDIYDALNNG